MQIKCIYYTLFDRFIMVQQEKTLVFWEKVNLLQYCSIIFFSINELIFQQMLNFKLKAEQLNYNFTLVYFEHN